MTNPSEHTPRSRLDPERRREQLLTHAMSAFATIGVERAGHGDVAKLAGVSTPTVFNYFPTREILRDAVFARIRETVMTMFAQLPDTPMSVADQIRMMALAYGLITETDPDMAKVFMGWAASFNPDVRVGYLSLQSDILDEITRRLPGEHEGRADARLIMAAADMFALMKLDQVDPEIIERFVNRVADALA